MVNKTTKGGGGECPVFPPAVAREETQCGTLATSFRDCAHNICNMMKKQKVKQDVTLTASKKFDELKVKFLNEGLVERA